MKKVDKVDDHKHLAIIFKGNRIYSVGYNKYNINDISEHAEYDAIKKLENKIVRENIKIKRFNLLVIRIHYINNNIKFSMSKPCKNCQKLLLSQFLIKKVYWTTNDGEIDFCSVNFFNHKFH